MNTCMLNKHSISFILHLRAPTALRNILGLQFLVESMPFVSLYVFIENMCRALYIDLLSCLH